MKPISTDALAIMALDQPDMVRDAIDIADSCSRSDIECNFSKMDSGWYNVDVGGAENDPWLPQCLRYLDARHLIEHHPDAPHCVRFLKVPK